MLASAAACSVVMVVVALERDSLNTIIWRRAQLIDSRNQVFQVRVAIQREAQLGGLVQVY